MGVALAALTFRMSSRRSPAPLTLTAPTILPSLLVCDFANLEAEIRRLEEAGVSALHLDVMDGHFVPNLSYGLPVVAAIRRVTSLALDVHLMIANPEPYLEKYQAAGADSLTIHVEAAEDAGRLTRRIKSLGMGAGLAINPHTPVERFDPYFGEFDIALVMSVEPGFGGQTFDFGALDKIRALVQKTPPGTAIAVDGGVNLNTIAACSSAGANGLVVGSAIFATSDYCASVANLLELAENERGGNRQPRCSRSY